jgi:hypothetical protein
VPRLVQAFAAALVVFGLSACSGGARVTRGGPLDCPRCQGDGSVPVDVGEAVTWDAANLENHGKVPVVLERVAYLHRAPGTFLLGPLVARDSHIGLVKGFPPPLPAGRLHVLEGYHVPPFHSVADDVDVLVGISPLRKGSFSYSGLEVYYRVGRKHYVTTFDEGVRVCAPRSVPASRCVPPPSIK